MPCLSVRLGNCPFTLARSLLVDTGKPSILGDDLEFTEAVPGLNNGMASLGKGIHAFTSASFAFSISAPVKPWH